MTKKIWIAIVISAALALGCSKGKQAHDDKHEQHASEQAKPGSHEDWCSEHAVPESQCTRCNPELIAAFKATGDWCPEHGVPESQCLKCNPNLKIVRPPPGQEDHATHK